MESDKSIEVSHTNNYDTQIQNFEIELVYFLEQGGLPSNNIFVSVPERINVFKNLYGIVDKIRPEERQQSYYLSKFIAAVATGLFDAALNYLWDETILQIRKRVQQYDLQYFYDNAVSGDKRKRLKDANDLDKIDDYELINGSKEIGLISELGFKHLQYINYMRNWASAAHPNQNAISGFQLISWLETCVKEVVLLPFSNTTIQIKKLLGNIKSNLISDIEAQEIAVFFSSLTQEQSNNLASGFFGIYTTTDTPSSTIQNINKLLGFLWQHVDEDTKNVFGRKYANFAANNDQSEKKLARDFLQLVSAESYIPDDLRILEIEMAIDHLYSAHKGYNNFYNEQSFAKQLIRIVGDPPKVPKQLNSKYVRSIVNVFLTNGNGVVQNTEPLYLSLISNFDSNQANLAILSFNDTSISSKLQFPLCQDKFKELITQLKPIVTNPSIKELIDMIEGYRGPLENMKNVFEIKNTVNRVRNLLK